MNKMIEALEMEVGEDDDDNHNNNESDHLISNKVGGFRAALDAKQQQTVTTNGHSIIMNGSHNNNKSSSRKSMITIALSVIVAIVILYGVLYQETTPPPATTIPNEVVHNNSNHKNDDNKNHSDEQQQQQPHPSEPQQQPKVTVVDESTTTGDTKPVVVEPASEPMKDNNKNDNNVDDSSTTTITTSSTATTTTNDEIMKRGGYKYSIVSEIIPDPFHVPIDDETKVRITEQWKKWKFWDGDEDIRPIQEDYCGKYKHRDIPGNDFPNNAWQTDAVFVNHFINDAELLIARAKEAIFTEYGHGKPLRPEQLAERLRMFQWIKMKNWDTDFPSADFSKKKGRRSIGGYTTTRSWDGLVRRLLHAIMTNDQFTVVMGGHSAAAGHGNHFHQSYMMQFHKIMAPVLARLGVQLITRNIGQGGLGTLHNAMGMKHIYGNNIDLLLWDSGMTERDLIHVDLFYRQALVSGNKVPVLWGGNSDLLRTLHDTVDADVGDWGFGWIGVPFTEDIEQAKSIPYAARYYHCSHDAQELCQANENRFCAICWVDRPDIDPNEHFTRLDSHPGSQVKWHPGWRVHQLTGRVLAFAILDALQDAIQIFSDGTMGGPPLDEDWWHMGQYYDNIQSKAKKYSNGYCSEIKNQRLPDRLCTIGMNARTHFTPRANPRDTGLNTLIQPADDGYVPTNYAKMEYDGPDLHNPCYDIPEGEIDVLAIVSNRRRRKLINGNETSNNCNNNNNHNNNNNNRIQQEHNEEEEDIVHPYYDIVERSQRLQNNNDHTNNNIQNQIVSTKTTDRSATDRKLKSDTGIIPGKGWVLIDEPPGFCDGTYNAICGRAKWQSCPMIGHHDARGVIIGDEYSGWLVFNLPEVTHGIIVLKIVTWMGPDFNWKTKDWTSVNNENNNNNNNNRKQQRTRSTRFLQNYRNITSSLSIDEEVLRLEEQQQQQQQQSFSTIEKNRQLTLALNDYPDEFLFDYAIDGVITTYTKQQLMDQITTPQRVVEFLVLMDDKNYTPKTNVEVAIRMRNCGRQCAIAVSHLYWA